MARDTGTPMSMGTIFLIVIIGGALVGALLGILRNQVGGSALLTGGLAGGIVGGLASLLFQRRSRALKRDR